MTWFILYNFSLLFVWAKTDDDRGGGDGWWGWLDHSVTDRWTGEKMRMRKEGCSLLDAFKMQGVFIRFSL